MMRIFRQIIPLGGIAACCAAAVQISQLVEGDAAREAWNYAITTATSLAGVGLTGFGLWKWRDRADSRPDDRRLLAATDLLFDHFAADEPAQEAVRVVARAVTERRYRKVES